MIIVVRPIELRDANAFIEKHHRHHKKVQGHRFSIACYRYNKKRKKFKLCGVAICGRPVSSKIDPLKVLDVTRLCTDGTYNVCSVLYSSAARAAKNIGYETIQTYILDHELGTTLKASGWKFVGMTKSRGHWHSRGKLAEPHLRKPKQRWIRELNPSMEELIP